MARGPGAGNAEQHRARTIAVGPLAVGFSSPSTQITARWDDLYAGFPNAGPGPASLEIAIEIRDGELVSSIDGDEVGRSDDFAEHVVLLSRELNHRKLDAETELVHLHAAAVARTGQCVLLAGRSGDGKSTLTARLAKLGWEYVTDEQVTLATDDWSIEPYPRPLTLRRDVWHLFPGIGEGKDGPSYRRVETTMRELGGTFVSGAAEPALLLAPRYAHANPNALLPFADVADVVQFLASCCHDLERTGTRGCAALVRLASTLPAHHLRFSDVDAATALVEQAFVEASAHHPTPVARVETPADEPVVAGLVQRAPGSTAWLFGDGSGIAFHPHRLRLARLDTLACALWEALDTPDTVDAILADAVDDTMRSALQVWITRLTESGLLVGA